MLGQCLEDVGTFINLIDSSNKFDIYNYDLNTVICSLPVNLDFDLTLLGSSSPNNALNEFIAEKHACAIYTDGSKFPSTNEVGASLVCPDLDVRIAFRLNQAASVFTAECAALSRAMDVILQSNQHSFLIFSDSRSAL